MIALTKEGIDHMDPFTRFVALEMVKHGEATIQEEKENVTE